MLIYASIEDAVIDRILVASQSNALGYRLAEVTSYGGEFDDEAFWNQVRRFPAVWVTVGGEKVRRLSANRYQCQPTIAVMVGARNVRGEISTRHGSADDVGSYQIADDVRTLLSGQSLGLTIKPLEPGAVRTLFNTRMGREACSVIAVEFATEYVYTPPDPQASDTDLLRVRLATRVVPGDAVDEAVDLINLRPA